jgi:solute:Na+ symporter, SSS family
MVEITFIDLIAIVAYIIAVLLIGYSASRRQSEESFLIAERKMSVWTGVATINATKTGASLLFITALVYVYSVSAIWAYIGILIGYLSFLPFALKLHKNSGSTNYTLGEYVKTNYGKLPAFFATLVNIITMGGFLIVSLIASAKVFEFFTGISYWLSVIIVSLIVLTYLMLSGFKAVVKTDVLQYIAIVFIMSVFLLIFLTGTSIPASELDLFAAGFGNIIGFILIGILLPFAQPELWQRVYAMPNKKVLKKSIIYSVIIYLIMSTILILIGVIIKINLPTIDPDISIVIGFSELLPAGFAGITIIVFFAAFMSSIDTYAYTASSSLIHDLFKFSSKKQTVRAIRATILAFMTLGTIIAIFLADLLEATFLFSSYIAVLAVPIVATYLKPSIRKSTLTTAFIIGILVLTLIIIYELIQNTLGPIIILKAIGSALVGLFIGTVYSKIKLRTSHHSTFPISCDS